MRENIHRRAFVPVRRITTGTEDRFKEVPSMFDREQYRRSIPSEWSHLPLRLRWARPGLFFVGSSIGIFALAGYLANRDTDGCLSTSMDTEIYSSEGNDVLRRAKSVKSCESWETVERSDEPNSRIMTAFQHPILFLRAKARPELVSVCMLLPVAFAWHIPRLHTLLFRHCTHSFRSSKSYTMLSAIFSHQLPFQWFNLFAVYATIPITSPWFMHAVDGVQHESSPWYHFTAFCLTAGMFSFFASRLLTYLRFRTSFRHLARGVPSPYTNPKLTKSLSYTLGTSGTIHACLTLSALSQPSTTIPSPAGLHLPGPIQLPSHSTAWALVCAVESICMWFMLGNIGWASNLCGVAFGAVYTVFGPSFWVSVRAAVHRVQFQGGWEVKAEKGFVDRYPYPGKYLGDTHPLFKRSFGEAMGWNLIERDQYK